LWYLFIHFSKEGSMSMLAVSVRRKRLFATAAVAAVLHTVATLGPALSAENEQIPNFAPDNITGWLKPHPATNFSLRPPALAPSNPIPPTPMFPMPSLGRKQSKSRTSPIRSWTIGLNDKTYIDNYRTPHTTQLHVVERFKLVDGGEALEVDVRVEDPGAFTMPWSARQRYRRDQRPTEVPLHEMVCAENNGDHFNQGLYPIPQASKPDF
jgi:hypothetical protein